LAILQAAFLGAPIAVAQDSTIKLGVLTDFSGNFSGPTGTGSLLAAQMAVEDFGGKAAGKTIEVLSPSIM